MRANRILIIGAVMGAVLAFAGCEPALAETDATNSGSPGGSPSQTASNQVATTGPISQATSDIVGQVVTWTVNNGAAGVAEAFPMTKSSKNPGSGPAATVFAKLYEVAWVSDGTTNTDTRIGLVNDTVFGHNYTGNQIGFEISEAINTEGMANATRNIPVIGFITRAASKMNIDLTAGYVHNTDALANGHFDERLTSLLAGVNVIKTFN